MLTQSSGLTLNLERDVDATPVRAAKESAPKKAEPAPTSTDAEAALTDVVSLQTERAPQAGEEVKTAEEIQTTPNREAAEKIAKSFEEMLNEGNTVRFQVAIGNIGDEDAKGVTQSLRFQIIDKEDGRILVSFPPEKVSTFSSDTVPRGLLLDSAA